MVVTPGSLAELEDDASAMPSLAAEELFRDAWPPLVRLGRLLTGSQELGEDLAQEAILGLLRRGPVDAPHAYLRRSLVNLSINRGRRATRERAHLRTLREEHVLPPEVDDMWPLIVALPPRQRAVLVLRYYEDLSEAEIARTLECRPGTVKSLASRTRELSPHRWRIPVTAGLGLAVAIVLLAALSEGMQV